MYNSYLQNLYLVLTLGLGLGSWLFGVYHEGYFSYSMSTCRRNMRDSLATTFRWRIVAVSLAWSAPNTGCIVRPFQVASGTTVAAFKGINN